MVGRIFSLIIGAMFCYWKWVVDLGSPGKRLMGLGRFQVLTLLRKGLIQDHLKGLNLSDFRFEPFRFNVTLFPCERSDNCRLRPAMSDFSELIFYLSLVDFHCMGGAFTWSNSHTWSTFDRFSVFSYWESHYLDVS